MPGCAYNIRSHSCDIQHIEEQYHRSSMILPLAASQRLAIMMTGNNATCEGDSGGPLFCKMDNVYVQYGIVAVRARGYPPGSISIYTRLSTYINWLKISAWKYDRD
ncbi:Tryptase [Trichinella zimbabwensis]|uniref:Tryptase n=1 Tax=Trichinella zimbabwensis TaxID=268475 RepID=A0A0V1HMB9_9BILA|nr:Tryptase [Trichinella zimbabwensis]